MITEAELIEGFESSPFMLALLGKYVDVAPAAPGRPLSNGTPQQDLSYYGGMLIGFMLAMAGIAEALTIEVGEVQMEGLMGRVESTLRQLADRERARRQVER